VVQATEALANDGRTVAQHRLVAERCVAQDDPRPRREGRAASGDRCADAPRRTWGSTALRGGAARRGGGLSTAAAAAAATYRRTRPNAR